MSLVNYFLGYDELNSVVNSDDIKIGKTNPELNELLIYLDYKKNNNSIFVVCPTLSIAQGYYDSLLEYLDESEVLFFPADELLTQDMLVASPDLMYERINTLLTLLEDKKKVIVTNVNGLIKKVVPKSIMKDTILNLRVKGEINPNTLTNKLIQNGYTKVSQVTATGEFSKRGEILDIFVFGYEKPIRLDFFDDEIESMKFFDPVSQRSDEFVDNISITPNIEFIYDNNSLEKFKTNIKQKLDLVDVHSNEYNIINNDIVELENRINTSKHMKYIDLFYDITTILDYVSDKKIYYIDNSRIIDTYNNIVKDYIDYIHHVGDTLKLTSYININDVKPNVVIAGLSDNSVDYNFELTDIPHYQGKMAYILDDISKNLYDKSILICLENDEKIEEFKSLLFEKRIYYNEGTIDNPKNEFRVYFTKEKLPSVSINNTRIMILNENNLYKVENKNTSKYKSIYKNATKISRYDELEIGDYIVHYDYGIGIYRGLKTLDNDGVNRDYIYVEYAENSKLYIPVDRISSVMKYASKEVPGIVVHKIGGSEWRKTKDKVRKKIKDISDRLIKIYSNRQKAKGYAFPLDDEDTIKFDQSFPFTLTRDQLRTIDDIKKDMESPIVMDRLVCGDVGYGKTEVALRAAFKAVQGLKQVAVLCPTTILSRQHYYVFKERMEPFGIRVELLNRFVSTKKCNEILNDLFDGKIDVIIGTHKLLSSSVIFNDLGLLIVDEEQRFGVIHKEKIKEIKANVDCITLSATPIPRTLQMSMLGIKDLSMIETPPKNRYPIQTYVLPRKNSVIRDAIEREIGRGGQVFYLYNKVEDINEVAQELSMNVPSAKICVAHGQMKSNELENVLMKFIDGEYNVLVCTTIIETGIDIPMTNTLIIHDATRLGLSQLYQIRGRVGRSNKIAYAYLMYDDSKRLTEESIKRLEAIKDFNELGSGFKIAMRDLAIRGSGDLLGSEQSGYIDSVGIDMYMQILNEEINVNKDIPNINVTPKIQTPLISMSINEGYVENEGTRILLHQRIDKIKSVKELRDFEVELIDRFGEIESDTHNYLWEKLLKNLLSIFHFNDLKIETKKIICTMDKDYSDIDGQLWFSHLKMYPNILLRYVTPNIILSVDIKKDKEHAIKELSLYLDELNNLGKK